MGAGSAGNRAGRIEQTTQLAGVVVWAGSVERGHVQTGWHGRQ